MFSKRLKVFLGLKFRVILSYGVIYYDFILKVISGEYLCWILVIFLKKKIENFNMVVTVKLKERLEFKILFRLDRVFF